MPISSAAPNFPLDVRTGAGIRAERQGAAWRFDLNDQPILTTGSGAFFRVATEAGGTKLRNGLTYTIQADRDFLGVPYIELDDNAPVRWVDVDGAPLARVVVGRVYRLSYDLAQDVMRSDVLSLVTNANLGPMAGATLKGNAGATPGGPQDIPLSQIAAPGNPVGDEIEARLAKVPGFGTVPEVVSGSVDRASKAWFRRSIAFVSSSGNKEFPYNNTMLQAKIAEHNYSFLYPQSFAIDEDANELFILAGASSGANPWGWISVYDLTTHVRKTTFTLATGGWKEGMFVATIGGTRYLYTVISPNIVRLNINSLPADGSTALPQVVVNPNAYSFIGFDGVYITVQVNVGNEQRNFFSVLASDGAKLADLEFPLVLCHGSVVG